MIAPTGNRENDTHFYPLRVYYEDTDAGGVVYYANYLRYAERARTEMFRSFGIEIDELHNTDCIFMVKNVSADYKKPARLYETIFVESAIERIGGASLTLRQIIKQESDTLVDLTIILVCVNKKGRPIKVNDDIKSRLKIKKTG
ncbi:MAG: YbgC/FadM family acyl-CoA thioesterase [Alphaproteobacteria bacterium]